MPKKDEEQRMERNKLLVNRLREYGETDACPMHMPGHKRQIGEPFLGTFPNPFSIDITEIDGFDNLHHAEGILRDSMEWAAGVYGVDRTWYLVNGSSCGILSAVCGTVRPGERILMSRNCHKSAYHGAILAHAEVDYVYPQALEHLGIQGGILASDVEKKLKEQPDTKAVLIVSPTYDGVVSDVEAIAETVHRYGIPLIVDEAHGAHFPFGGEVFPKSAIDCGADLVIQSLHKTLPSLTQTAVLHGRCGRVDVSRVERFLQMFQSSSPSYVFMAAIEQCIWEMAENGASRMAGFGEQLAMLRRQLGTLKRLKVPEKGDLKMQEHSGVFDLDPSKILVSCRGCGVNGETLGEWLRQRYQIEMEMCGADYAVAITTCLDGEERLARLGNALYELDQELLAQTGRADWIGTERALSMPRPQICRNLFQAAEAFQTERELSDCAGEISGEFIYLYPPGIPIVAPGERITEEIMDLIHAYKRMGLPVQGMADPQAKRLNVLAR